MGVQSLYFSRSHVNQDSDPSYRRSCQLRCILCETCVCVSDMSSFWLLLRRLLFQVRDEEIQGVPMRRTYSLCIPEDELEEESDWELETDYWDDSLKDNNRGEQLLMDREEEGEEEADTRFPKYFLPVVLLGDLNLQFAS